MNATTQALSAFETLIQHTRSAYGLGPATGLVVAQLNENAFNPKQLAEAMSQDAWVTERVLKLANTRMFGSGKPSSTVPQAIEQAGPRAFCWLTLSVGLPENLLQDISPLLLDRFWRHAISKAVAARELTLRTGEGDPHQAFACGVLQHVGLLALIQHLGEPYIEFLQQVWADQGDLSPLEVASMGFDHRAVSARLVESWGLPNSLVNVLDHPWHPSEVHKLNDADCSLAKRLHLAEQFARVVHDRDDLSLYRLADIGRRFYELTQDHLASMLTHLDNELQELAQVFSFTWEDERRLDQLLSDPSRPLGRAFTESGTNRCRVSADALDQMDKVEPLLAAVQSEDLDDNGGVSFGRPSQAQRLTAATPITHEDKLVALLKHVVQRCRQKRCPLALAFAEIDEYQLLRNSLDQESLDEMVESLTELHTRFRAVGDLIWRIGPARWALVLQDHDRGEAVQQCRDRLEAIRRWSQQRVEQNLLAATVSFGVAGLALPPKNFDPRELLARADGCLSGAQLSGGDTLKSIGV